MLELVRSGADLDQWTAAGFFRLLYCWMDNELDEYCNYPEAFAGTKLAFNEVSNSDDRSGVYVLFFRHSGKFYIGSSYLIYRRFAHHRSSLRKGSHYNNEMQKEYDRYRRTPDVIYICTNTEGEARAVEQRLIDLLFTDPCCLNQRHMVEEYRPAHGDTRKKLSDAAKAQWQDPDFRSRIRDIYADPEVRTRRAATAKRLAANPEYLEKISLASKRTWEDPDYAARQRQSGAAVWEMEGFRERHGEAMRAKWADPEYRASVRSKISEAAIGRRIPVVIDGVEYTHVGAAATALGISESTARRRAKGLSGAVKLY